MAGVARAAILAAADALFYERGIAPVSVEAIAAAAGVTRRTLYYHFASKDVLVEAYLERRDAVGRRQVEGAGSLPPAAALLAVFDWLERWFGSNEFRGCALTNAVGENGDTLIIAGPITARHKSALRDWFVRTCTASGAHEPGVLGEQLMLLFDGALTSARTRGEPAIAAYARRAARTLMGAHGIAFAES